MTQHMTATILAGGMSSRMGCNKAFLRLSGKTFIECQIELLRKVFDEIIISANSPAKYQYLNLPVIKDIYPGKGPLGGIYTGLINSNSLYTFMLACDMPLIEAELIRYMAGILDGYDVVIPQTGDRLEPLHAFYSKNCIEPIKRTLDRNDLKVTSFFHEVNIKKVLLDELIPSGRLTPSLANLNTMEEYNRLKKELL